MRSFLFRAVAVSLFVSGSFTALSAKTWTGAVNANWSNPGNWSPQAVPVAGEPLVFPSGNGMFNDLPPGLAIGPLTFQSGTINLSGNQIILTGDVTLDPNNALYCSAPLKIGSTIAINGGSNTYFSDIDANGQSVTFSSTHPMGIKTLTGTGTVNGLGQGIQLDGNGSFSGTLTGAVNLNTASLPNATFSGGTLTGAGTLGTTVTADLSPGSLYTVGYIQTKSLTITHQFSVLLGYSSQDAALVTGTVTLTGAALAVSVPGSVQVGTSIVIMTNDGTDPIVGTFNGLPEGAAFSANGTTFVISYHGSDGNDVTLTAMGASKTWVGDPSVSSPNVHWSDASAWLPHAIPVAGEALIFPNGTTSMVNDLVSGFTVGGLTFQGGSPSISGNALTLTGPLTFQGLVSHFSCAVPLTIGNSLHIGGAQTNVFSGPIDVNGQTLEIDTANTTLSGPLNGSGVIELSGSGAQISGGGTFSGRINGSVDVTGSLPNADITAGVLSGNGSTGRVTAQFLRPGNATVSASLDLHTFGVLQIKGLTLSYGGSYDIDVSATASDSVHVTGAVSLNGQLNVTVTGAPPSFSQQFVIIDNDGTDPIDGTFANLPAGSTVHAGNSLFRIFYDGGDGNDVVLISALRPVIAVTAVKSSTVIGEKATFNVSVSSPFGTVVFAADGSTIGSASLNNGTASVNISSLSAGDHAITANFLAAGPYTDAVSSPLTFTVARGETSTTLQAVGHPVFGASRFSIGIVLKTPAAAPLTGSVSIRENGKDIASTVVSNPATSITIPSLTAGSHTLVASYSGSSSILASDSLPLAVTVDPVPMQLLASYQLTPGESDGNVALSITAVPTSSVAYQPSGTIAVSEAGSTLAEMSVRDRPPDAAAGNAQSDDYLLRRRELLAGDDRVHRTDARWRHSAGAPSRGPALAKDESRQPLHHSRHAFVIERLRCVARRVYQDPNNLGLVCTEELVVMLTRMGIETGLDVDRVLATRRMVERIVGRRLRSETIKSGRIPKAATGL
jgi:hypothetical protein